MADLVANKRPFVNCKRLTMFPMTDEVNETYSTTPISFEKRLTTYSDTLASNTTNLNGDGELIETVITEGAGTLSLGIHHLTDEERVPVYGEKLVNGAVVSTGNEIPPYMCVALIAVKRNGRVNLRKYFKVAFRKHDENVTQQEENGINYSMPTLNGTYVKNTTLGMKVARREVDPTTTEGAEIIEKWFTDATYIGEETSSSGSGSGSGTGTGD